VPGAEPEEAATRRAPEPGVVDWARLRSALVRPEVCRDRAMLARLFDEARWRLGFVGTGELLVVSAAGAAVVTAATGTAATTAG
jgi:hypothetical protein